MSDSASFTKMATRIDHNAGVSTFGGAAVIVFPPIEGQALPPIELLMLDSTGDFAQFLATLSTRLQMISEELKTRNRGGYR